MEVRAAAAARFVCVCALITGVLAGIGCSTTVTVGGPANVDTVWQVVCTALDGTTIPGCTGPISTGVIGVDETDAGVQRVSCAIDETTDTRTVSINLSATRNGITEGISLSRVTVPRAGGAPIGQCLFSFTEGETFVGACGGSPPSAAQPCDVMIQFNTAFAYDQLTTFLYVRCIEVPSTTSSTRRSLIGRGSPDDPPEVGLLQCPITRH